LSRKTHSFNTPIVSYFVNFNLPTDPTNNKISNTTEKSPKRKATKKCHLGELTRKLIGLLEYKKSEEIIII